MSTPASSTVRSYMVPLRGAQGELVPSISLSDLLKLEEHRGVANSIVFERDGMYVVKDCRTGEILGEFTQADSAINFALGQGVRQTVLLAPGSFRVVSPIYIRSGSLIGCGRSTAIYSLVDTELVVIEPTDPNYHIRLEDVYISPRATSPTKSAIVITSPSYTTSLTARVLRNVFVERVPADFKGVGVELRAGTANSGIAWSVFENLAVYNFETGILFNIANASAWINANTFIHTLVRLCKYGLRVTGSSQEICGVRVNRFYHFTFEGDNDSNVSVGIDFSNPNVAVWHNTFYDTTILDLPSGAKAIRLSSSCTGNTFIGLYCDPTLIEWGGYGNAVYAHSFPYQRATVKPAEQSTTSTSYVDTDATVTVTNLSPSRIIARGSAELRSGTSGSTVYARMAILDPSGNVLAQDEKSTTSSTYTSFTFQAAADAFVNGSYSVKLQFRSSSTSVTAFIRNKSVEVKAV